MLQILTKRLIGLIFVIFVVTFITFTMGFYAPGNPIATLMGDHPNAVLEAQLRHAYGLDLPFWQQYFNFLVSLVKFNFGTSFKYQGRAVVDVLKDGFPISLELGLWTLILWFVTGIPLGILSALKANTWIDTASMGVALAVYALPIFVLAVLVRIFIVSIDKSLGLSWPVAQWGTPWLYDWDNLQYKIAPIFVFWTGGMAFIARLTRTSMMEVLKQDYVRTARAKGLQEKFVIYRHALRNAMIPLITVLGPTLGLLVTGGFFIELIFSLPGVASIAIGAINDLDYPVIQATVVLLAILVVLGNLISDILYTVVDPRIKAA
ncbi:MAG TPA: ABC transporter permease [Ktedonosporobacter sp.]|nr:ABC transporter permease [Ktedonosporobacter sp.]